MGSWAGGGGGGGGETDRQRGMASYYANLGFLWLAFIKFVLTCYLIRCS